MLATQISKKGSQVVRISPGMSVNLDECQPYLNRLLNYATMRGSSSTAMTFLAFQRSNWVRFPVPGPISNTTSVGLIPDLLTISVIICEFMRMCCPKDLLNTILVRFIAFWSSFIIVDVKIYNKQLQKLLNFNFNTLILQSFSKQFRKMGPCISHPKQQIIKTDFHKDRQMELPNCSVRPIKPLTTTLYSVLRKQSNVEVLHSTKQQDIIRNSNMVNMQKMAKGDLQVIYNFKNVVIVGKPEKYVRIAEDVTLKSMFVIGEKEAKRFLQEFPIFKKLTKRSYQVSNIPLLVFSQDQLATYRKIENKSPLKIFIHTKKYSNSVVYKQLNILKIIQPITSNFEQKQKEMDFYKTQIKKIDKTQVDSVLILHQDYIKQPDLRKLIGDFLVNAYNISQFSANGYLKRILTSQETHEPASLASLNNPARQTFYSDKRKTLNQYSVVGKSQTELKQNKKSVKDLKSLNQNGASKDDQNLMPSESAIKRLQSPQNKLQLNQSTKPYFNILKNLYKQSNEQTVQRAYSINILLLTNICNNHQKQESFRTVKTMNKNISQISRFKSGKQLLQQNGWMEKDGNWVNRVETKYLKIFRTDLDLAYRIFKQSITK